MRSSTAAAGSAAFFLLGPGIEVGVGPWVLTGFETGSAWATNAATSIVGTALLAAGLALLLHAYARFARDGLGTPAPTAPPRHLVVEGAYRHVRNPMYVGSATAIVGEAILLAQPILLVAAAAFVAAMAALSRLHEEPSLARRFGPAYEAYRREVPGWWPRPRAWRPAGDEGR